MRPAMLPSFLQVVVTNSNRGQKDLRFFEIGKTYFKAEEKETLGILMTGRRSHDWRSSRKEGIEIFDLKGVLERIFNRGQHPVFKDSSGPKSEAHQNDRESSPGMTDYYDPSCAATIFVDGKQIGSLGKIDRKILNNWDIKNQDIYFAEAHLGDIFLSPPQSLKYQPVSEFPAIVRDVSLAVKKEIPYKRIEDLCVQQGGDILKSVHFIEQYLGDKIQSGHKGLVFSCHYQSVTRTLREDEVSAVHERILQALTHELGAIRR
jgi:phenylalanyl-tRNA synthetase beta chain